MLDKAIDASASRISQTHKLANPVFSVIVPVYNVKPYLSKCLDSILSQTFSDFELIIVDDGSTDGSGEICDEYALKDPRIKVFHQQNGGLSAARNTGLDHASGTYVYFADSDDYLMPELLEKGYEQFKQDCDLVAINNYEVNLDGKQYARNHKTGRFDFGTPEKRLDFILNHLYKYEISWEVWDLIFKRSLIEQYNLRYFDNRVIFAEDQYFVICYIAHADSVISIPDPLYVYIKREGSLSVNFREETAQKMSRCAHEVYNTLIKYPDCQVLTDQFPLIYFSIIRGELVKNQDGVSADSYRSMIKRVTEHGDGDFFREQMKDYKKYREEFMGLTKHRHTALSAVNLLDLIFEEKTYFRYRVTKLALDAGKTAKALLDKVRSK